MIIQMSMFHGYIAFYSTQYLKYFFLIQKFMLDIHRFHFCLKVLHACANYKIFNFGDTDPQRKHPYLADGGPPATHYATVL